MAMATMDKKSAADPRQDAKQQELKLKALESTLAQVEKAHGKGAVMRLGDDVRPPISVIPIGYFSGSNVTAPVCQDS